MKPSNDEVYKLGAFARKQFQLSGRGFVAYSRKARADRLPGDNNKGDLIYADPNTCPPWNKATHQQLRLAVADYNPKTQFVYAYRVPGSLFGMSRHPKAEVMVLDISKEANERHSHL